MRAGLVPGPNLFGYAAMEAAYRYGDEWLLQVLNDVRVGSWIALGSPAEHPEMEPEMSKQTMSHVMTMDIAAFFEMGFMFLGLYIAFTFISAKTLMVKSPIWAGDWSRLSTCFS